MEMVNFDPEKFLRVLTDLFAEQEGVEIQYTLKKLDEESVNEEIAIRQQI